MITWGISGNSHDAALAVFEHQPWNKDSMKLLFASHSERFSGLKNDPHLNDKLINYAKQYGEPEEVIWYEKPKLKTIRQLFAGQGREYWKKNNIKTYLKTYGISCPIRYSGHHRSHVAGGYYSSGLRSATIVVVDSMGEFDPLTIWKAVDKTLKCVYRQGYPHSVGLWYSAMTQRIHLKPQEDEYILMGMAAYGDPDRLYKDIKNDFFSLDNGWGRSYIKTKENLHRGCLSWRPDLNTMQDLFDIAAGTQRLYEELLVSISNKAKRIAPNPNLILTGGCALNCSANSKIYNDWDRVWIMPNPGDSGSAVGSVLSYYDEHISWPGPYLGYNIEGDYPVEQLITELKTTGIAGVANGKAEFGPRALGNRSLLADPRGSRIKDKVNAIKHRQEFRPFAPAIIGDRVNDYFDGPTGPYMQYTASCRAPNEFPAIVHADGTSRVQTVSKTDNPGFRRLLERWEEETGCPMLLNTSLNIKGQPIVNDLTDAQEFAKMYNVKVYTHGN